MPYKAVQCLAVVSGLIAVCRSAVRLPLAVWNFFVKVCRRPGFGKIIAEFLTEVAVLVTVFPALYTIIQKGRSNVTGLLVVGSLALSVVCLFVAGIINMYLKE